MALLSNSNIGVGRKNYIINGDFRLWQRGIDSGSIASATKTYIPDRFHIYHSSDGLMRFTQSQSAPTVLESGHYFSDSAYILVPTADASIGASQYSYMGYTVEGYDFRHLVASEFITLSFWVRSSVTGTYCVKFGNSGADRSYIAEYVVNTASTWEKKIITIPMNFSGGTWNYTNGSGLLILWVLASGSTFHTTANIWATGNYLSTSNQVNFMSSTSNEIRFNGIQLECGPNGTDFEMRHISEELSLAQRYYEKSYNLSVNPGTVANEGILVFTAPATGTFYLNAPFKTTKRVSGLATVKFYSPTTGVADKARDTTGGGDVTVTNDYFAENFLLGHITATADRVYSYQWAASAEL